MDTQNELLIRIDERVKSLFDLVTSFKAAHDADSAEIWLEVNSLKRDVEDLKLKAAAESIPIKIRNGLLWLLTAALIGWSFSLIS